MVTSDLLQATQQQQDERGLLLNLLFSYKRELIIEHIRRRDIRISRSISVADLRTRIEMLLDSQELTVNDLAQILNHIEGWGRQQIYLYQYIGGQHLKAQWLNPVWVENHFRQLNKSEIYNNTRPIVLPDSPTLVSVEHDTDRHRIRFIWVEKRTRLERDEESDPPPDRFRVGEASSLERVVYQAYREITVRGLMFFDWDIENDDAMLMIHKLTGTDYAQVRDARLSELKEILLSQDFRLLPVSSIVTQLHHSDEVVRRELTFQTVNNEGRLSVASGRPQEDVFADTVLEQARSQIIDNVTGLSGSLRWKTENNKHIALELYGKIADDQRIGIAAQELEEDIRYVLRRIRTYCT
jgi:hypothetical protein